jgi:hypothetical protein
LAALPDAFTVCATLGLLISSACREPEARSFIASNASVTAITHVRVIDGTGGDHIGSISIGNQADLVLVRGNPSTRISDVRNVDLVFKDGVAYDPAALILATQGTIGQIELRQFFPWPYNVILIALVSLLAARIITNQQRRPRLAPAHSPAASGSVRSEAR